MLELENATKNWIKLVKNAMDTAIPKSTYKFTYQLNTAPEIRNLETQFKNLRVQNFWLDSANIQGILKNKNRTT